MILVGITGIIGSGKTTVSKMLSQEGIPVIDLDKIGKEVTDYEEVVKRYCGGLWRGICSKQ